jgi:hypothetical protein
MKSNKFFNLGILFIILIFFGVYVYNYELYLTSLNIEDELELNNQQVTKIVITYCELSSKKDFEEIKKITTYTPAHYLSYRGLSSFASNLKVSNLEGNTKETSTIPGNNNNILRFNFGMVTESFPLSFNTLRLPIKKIEGLMVKDNYAKLTALFDTKNNETRIYSYDFFLVKENNNWRIFKVSISDPKDMYPQ